MSRRLWPWRSQFPAKVQKATTVHDLPSPAQTVRLEDKPAQKTIPKFPPEDVYKRQEEALAYLAYIAQAQEGSALVSLLSLIHI